MSKKFAIWSLAMFLIGLCACSKDSDSDADQGPVPTVKIEAGEVTATSASFTITATDAERVSYLVVREGDTNPDQLAIITNGKQVDVAQAAVCTEVGLEPNVAYVVHAAARNGSRISEPASVKMTLGNAPQVVLTPVEATRTSLSFTIDASGAEKVSYLVVKADKARPDAAAILANGKTADPDAEQTYAETELEPGTKYVVLAASSSGGASFAVVHFTMSTLKERYEIGDHYNTGSVSGMVYKVAEDGRSGMILSMDETAGLWAIVPGMSGSYSETDGPGNMEVIKAIEDWQTIFPAFKWCDDHNGENTTGWYFPAIAEVEDIYNAFNGGGEATNPVARNQFNLCLRNHGAAPIFEGYYWSSTDLGTGGQYILYYNFNENHRGSLGHWIVQHIRAVKAF